MKKYILFIFILGSYTSIRAQYVFNGSNKHTFTTNHGKIEMGPFNSSWAHIYSDRAKFIFNKPVYTTANIFSSYNNDLILQTEGNTRLVINDDTGYVGIGTGAPGYPLHVVSGGRTGVKIGGPNSSGGAISDLIFAPSNGGKIGDSNYWDWSFRTDSWANTLGDLVLYSHNGSSYTSPIIVQSDGDVALVTGKGALRNGNVGIGTNNPDAKLAVNGNIHAKEVKVDLNVPGPDYVFKEDYYLKSLEEVQSYIAENGHLPNIPSAKEMETNGIHLGVMNMKLLEKIEELTLYVIQQEKISYLQTLENEKINEKVIKLEKLVKNLISSTNKSVNQ